MTERTITFGAFRLFPDRRALLDGEKPVRLGSRALELLIALVEHPGELIAKERLIAHVWPETHVEEVNLRVHMVALRRALGDGVAGNRFITNIPGRGYSFVASVSVAKTPVLRGPPLMPDESRPVLPAPLSRIVGRDDVIKSLVDQMKRQRLVTVVGPGGVGKTTVALAAAERMTDVYEGRIWFIDLAPIADPSLVPSALGSVLGLTSYSIDPTAAIVAFLKDGKALVVLDNCEHVIEAAAVLTESLIKGTASVHVLATSREALRAEGEQVHRLSPLAVPPSSASLIAFEALAFPSVQLFVERAAANMDSFALTDENAPFVADICRKLDGIALAIELAAGRVDALGVRELAAHLDDRFRLLMRGRRTALLRQQTLNATFDWSYGLLPEVEQRILRNLSVFAGGFTLEAASSVAASAEIAWSSAIDWVGNLVEKSLVAADVGDHEARFRLLDTTRAYAFEKLAESGERGDVARRHAEYYRNLFQRAAAESQTRPAAEWLAVYGLEIDNVRVALDWAFSPGGVPSIGVELTIASVPHWFQFSHTEEYRGRIERALASVGRSSGQHAHLEMQLFFALAQLLRFVKGHVREGGEAWANALKLAEVLDETNYRLQALRGLWSYLLNSGETRAALARAEQFSDLAANAPDPADRLFGDLMIGISQHYLGDQTAARRYIEFMLEGYRNPAPASHTVRFLFDQGEQARAFLARVLWLQGFPDQAMHLARSIAENTPSLNHAPTACQVLALACPVALLTGDLAAAERFLALLFDRSARGRFDLYALFGRCLEGILMIARGDLGSGLRQLRTAIDELRDTGFTLLFTAFLGAMGEGLADAGLIAEGLAAIDEALERATRSDQLWCTAELLRVKGVLLLREGAPAVTEDHFLQGLNLARQQGALSWELRTATSLARLWQERGQPAKARSLLAPIYDRFTEGHGTADLRAAKIILDALA